MSNLRTAQRDSRVLVLSQRAVSGSVCHTTQYELEDLLLAIDDTVLLAPGQVARPLVQQSAARVANAVRVRAGRPRRAPLHPAPLMRRTPLRTSHDLLLVVVHHPFQLAYLDAVPGWRERCRRAVCLVVEMWGSTLEEERDYVDRLRQFDAVHLFNPGPAAELAARGVPSPTFMPLGIDALRWAPPPAPHRRSVDVLSYGRRSPDVHAQLLALAERDGLTYLYDTVVDGVVRDHAEHRAALSGTLQRTRYTLAHTINDAPDRRRRSGGQEALSSRYLEGAVGGAVLLGSRPRTPDFDACFPWTDAVIDLPWDGGDVSALVAHLDEDPERLATARAAGLRGALARHDWAHRWAEVLQAAGLSPRASHEERLQRLAERAEAVSVDVLLDAERADLRARRAA